MKQRWRFTGRKWMPPLGEVLTWELAAPYQYMPMTYVITPYDFWDGIR